MIADLVRLLLFFAIVSVIRSVVQAVARAFGGTRPNTPSGQAGKADSSKQSASTLLHQDPVCGTYVAAGTSFRKICGGEVFHFCSEECRDRYAA